MLIPPSEGISRHLLALGRSWSWQLWNLFGSRFIVVREKSHFGVPRGALEPSFAGVKHLCLSSVFQNDTFSQLKRQKSRGKWVLLQGHIIVFC